MSEWRRLFFRGASFGAGCVLALSLIVGGVFWYRSRPRAWDERAVSATFETVEIETKPNEASYAVEFVYDLQNNTNSTYSLNPYSLVLMGRASNGSLSKEWGHYQTSDPTLTGPAFIPAHTKAKITLHTAYEYPNGFTAADKGNVQKLSQSLNRRLSELNGIVIFDEAQHYRVDLPGPWQKWDDVRKVKEEN